MIEVRNLSFKYKTGTDTEIAALDNINLKIYEGQFVSLIGSNGSGKTTLARHFNALLTPQEGCVNIDGIDTKDEDNLWEIRKRVGMVFQNPDNQIVGTTIEQDIAFGLENIRVPSEKIERRVQEVSEVVGIRELIHREPHLLSGGQKQRVAIAGVLAMRPRYIVLDEPTALLDPEGRGEVLETVKKLNRQGIGIIYITHFIEEALQSDRVIVIDRGKIALDGSPKRVLDELERLGLDIPEITKLARELKNQGMDIREDVLTVDEMVKSLCP